MKTRHHIIALPNPHLRKSSKTIEKVTPTIKKLIADMESATLDWEDSRPHEVGVALAAVQIDELERVVIIRNDFDNKKDRTFSILINPKIVKAWGNITYDYEGCLSVKDIYGFVPRYNKVKVKAMSVKGTEVSLTAEGFLARILQHEIDHTNGIMFIDYIKDKDAFYRLNEDGKLAKLEPKDINAARLFRD
ncbi:MAG TPA: peptide deformylase [Candidatus Saccharimonadales bacterium]|nr:peptide deformylase [Candidatus Saccharimonadales bacterium]